MAGAAATVQPWPGVVDLRAERHGGRIEVRAYLDRGGWLRLCAPYDGRLLAHDPGFEHKYVTECHGKAKTEKLVHVCKKCDSEDAFCCVMKKGGGATKGMEDTKSTTDRPLNCG